MPRGELLARFVVRFRFVVVVAWLAGAGLAATYLPGLNEARGDALGSLVPRDASAFKTQARSAELFRFPVLSNTIVVQRDPNGLSREAQTRVFERALRIARREYPDLLSVRLALPFVNTVPDFTGAPETATGAVTYLYFEPTVGLEARDRLASWFTDRRLGREDALAGVTGVVPARVEQGRLIEEALPLVEAATVLLVALVIGLTFRSLLAPLLTLVAVGLSFIIAVRAVAALGATLGVPIPRELEPLVLVLLLGIVTDYAIFFLSGLRHRLSAGEERLSAARGTAVEFTPIVLVAGVIVAAGTASLLAARLEFFRVFGPGLALTVVVGLAVAVTFVPASLALLGRLAFWPSPPGGDQLTPRTSPGRTPLAVRLTRSRALAAVFSLVCVAVLVLAATGLRDLSLGVKPIRSLPNGSEPARAASAAGTAFGPGVLSPTLLLLEDPGIAGKRGRLARLQKLVENAPGVAAVIGPRQLPAETPLGVVLAESGDAARFVIFLQEEPLSNAARSDLDRLRRLMPALLAAVGLADARASFGGNTALADETISTIVSDIVRIGVAALLVNFLLLVVFLRALVAPIYLLATSVLSLAAALGLTGFVFGHAFGQEQVTYYVPFMAAVLLVSLGSDYNVFLVGRIWHAAREVPLRSAVAEVAPRASGAINVAGFALALSFGLLALVPLSSFREFAFAMVVGILLEAFVVRTYLVPALLSLVGTASGWPGRFRSTRAVEPGSASGGSREGSG